MRLFFLCNLGTPNSAAMGCSQPKEFRTGLRIVVAFLKVILYYNICGPQVPLPLPVRRGLILLLKFATAIAVVHSAVIPASTPTMTDQTDTADVPSRSLNFTKDSYGISPIDILSRINLNSRFCFVLFDYRSN